MAMRWFGSTAISLAIAGGLLMGLFCSPSLVRGAESYRPEVGRPHPDFVLPRIDTRQPVSLSQFRGKKVLLVHFASW